MSTRCSESRGFFIRARMHARMVTEAQGDGE